MVFSDPSFLFYFLPLVLSLYWLGAWRQRNLFLLVVSLVFYTSGGGRLVLLLVGSSTLTFCAALAMEKSKIGNRKQVVQRATVVLLLASLLVWKYAGFVLQQLTEIIQDFGGSANISLNLVLPIAISFYTFQCISYLIDVGRREVVAEKNFITFLCYILFFPHLLAGPIVRYTDVADQLATRPTRLWESFTSSCPRFFWGLAKKVLIADQAAQIANAAFGIAGYQIGALDTVIGVVAYSIQIYFDFSGYSDMAIGLAGMFGIKFQENFRHPYSSSSVTDFWRRWHISLSSWFKDYVYIPLGGNRKGSRRTYYNLVLIFVLTGLWHGANWTFLVWGLIHGTALILERYFLTGDKERPWLIRALLKIWTITVVMLGWLLFRAVDLAHAGELLSALGGRSGFGISPLVQAALTPQRIFWTCIGLFAFLLPKQKSFGEKLGEEQGNLILSTVALAGGALASVYVLSSSFSPFLYFQF